MPCLLTGTGMAFPWPLIRNAPLASGNIVEDMQLGLDLTLAGVPPLLCPDAQVTGRLPQQHAAAASQRTRWEHGHMQTIKTQIPRLLLHALTRLRPSALAIALELAVPPLSLLTVVWAAASFSAMVIAPWLDWRAPLLLVAIGWFCFVSALFLAWLRFGRDLLPFSVILRIPAYVACKLPLYKAFFGHRQTAWIRTARDFSPVVTPSQQLADAFLSTASVESGSVGLNFDRQRVVIGDALIDNLTMSEAIDRIEALIRAGRPSYVVTPNVDHIVKLQSDPAFRDAYRDAGLVLPDGMPLLWAARFLKTPLKQKVSGSDLFPRFCRIAAEKGYRLFFLGGRQGAADRAADLFRQQHPGIQIQTHCPPMGFERDEAENAQIVKMIRDFAPHILFVGLGAPKQELWLHKHHQQAAVPVSIGVGASFDFVAGYVRRAPVLFQKTGFEWAWRLMQEPRRMYRRYLLEDPEFFRLVWKQKRATQSEPFQAPVSGASRQ
jgi:N-acetylglucosaminyldiphosphoundecaprenol N-acetyl-beta-D-mannosaminyltransferase